MTSLVVDASVVVKWFLPEVLAEPALRVAPVIEFSWRPNSSAPRNKQL